MRRLFLVLALLSAVPAAAGEDAAPDPRQCQGELFATDGDFVTLYRALRAARAQVQILTADKAALQKQLDELKAK